MTVDAEGARVGDPEPDVLGLIVKNIWGALLALPATAAAPAEMELAGRPLITGHIEVNGQWQGRITVTATAGLATGIAVAMFDKGASDVLEEDRRDAIGELTNVIGGNFKALLAPLESRLTLPKVGAGPPAVLGEGERLLGDVGLLSEGQSLVVRFVAGTPPG